MLEKFTLDAALGLLKRYWPFLVGAALLVYIVILNDHLDGARKELKAEATFRTSLATVLGAKGNSPDNLLNFAQFYVQEDHNRGEALAQIDAEAKAAKARSDKADADYKRAQEENARKLAASQKKIDDLQSRKGTGNAEADLKIIDEDTKAAWKGWR